MVYWAVGWGLSQGHGGTAFSGGSEFFFYGMRSEMYPRFFLEYVWAANAATIVSGAIAERCHLGGYVVYTIIVTGEEVLHILMRERDRNKKYICVYNDT